MKQELLGYGDLSRDFENTLIVMLGQIAANH